MEIIIGKVPSKSNCYKIISKRKPDGKVYSSLKKSDSVETYEKSFYMQCSLRNQMIAGLFEIHLKVFYENMRPDLDNCLKVILDCLQSCKTIKNDRNCVKVVAEKFVDKNNPRVEFEIIEI